MKHDSAAFSFLARPYRLVGLFCMLIKYGHAFFRLGEHFEFLLRLADTEPGEGESYSDLVEDDVYKGFRDNLEQALTLCRGVNLDYTAMLIERLLATPREIVTYEWLRRELPPLQDRMSDESAAAKFLYVSPTKAKFYETADPFGPDVAAKFSSATFDIEEAAKSFALGRNTACVMHLMRVVEVGLKAVGKGLNISYKIKTAQPNWNQVLIAINTEIQDRIKNAASYPSWPTERPFFENVYADLRAIQTAWRNPSMHADKVYDSERAEDIYNSVRGFMRHLAEHLDESGTFTP